MKKLKNFAQQKTSLFVLVVCVIIATFMLLPKSWLYVFQDDMLNAYAGELFDILWPVAMSLLFGFGFVYHRKGFGATLVAGMFLFVLHIGFLLLFIWDGFRNGVQWQTTPAILLGIVHMIGIGVREEVMYRGIIANALTLKYAKDKKSLWFIVIVSALIFGCMHITNIFFGVKPMGLLAQIVSASGAGILFTAIYLRGGNIWVLMLVHAIIDATPSLRSTFMVTTATRTDMVSEQNPWGAVINICMHICLAMFLLRKSKQPAIFARLEQLRNQQGWTAEKDMEISGK